MPHRIDWQAVKATIPSDNVLTVLPRRFVSLILSASYDLGWRATYRIKDYDFADWDELQRLISEGLAGLNDMATLQDLIDAIIGIQTQFTVMNQCCDDVQSYTSELTDEVYDQVGDVPANIVSAGYASSSSDWAGFMDYKCMVAHLTLTAVIEKVRGLSELATAGKLEAAGFGGIAAILGSIVLAYLGAPLMVVGLVGGFGAVAGLYAVVGELLESDFVALGNDLEFYRDEITCAFYSADGTTASLVAMYEAINDNIGADEAIIVRNLNMAPIVSALYAGRYDTTNVAQLLADDGYDPADFTCCETPIGDPIGKIVSQIGLTSHAVGDIVHENELIEFSSVVQGSAKIFSIILVNTSGTGPLEGNVYWVMQSQTGWSNYGTVDAYWRWRHPFTPFWRNGTTYNFDWGQTAPYSFTRDVDSDAGYVGYSLTTWSGSFKLFRTWP